MRIFLKWLLIGLPVLLVVLFLLSPVFSLGKGVRCWSVRHSVLTALDQASSVQVIEHSARRGYDPDYKETIYATITLTPKQIEDLRSALPLSLDFSGGIKQCKFEEHHRIEIKDKDGSVRTLHLCFKCGQLYVSEMNQSDRYFGEMPPAWPASLRPFISSLGLHPDGPWPLTRVGP
jgi:hypothetical protein